MKNKTLLFLLLIFSQWSFSQTFTTGVVNLSSTANLTMSVKLDISTEVTMTITGPPSRWFALGFGAVNMANGTDVIGVHSAGTLTNFDARLTGNAAPVSDAQQNWTITSDQVAAGVRTIIATRALNTGDANDYIFTAAIGTLSLIWARGSSNSFSYLGGHGSLNRGVVTATFTEVDPTLTTVETSSSSFINIYPNPSNGKFQITLEGSQVEKNCKMEIYNVYGEIIYQSPITNTKSEIDLRNKTNGLYFVKIYKGKTILTKKIVIE